MGVAMIWPGEVRSVATLFLVVFVCAILAMAVAREIVIPLKLSSSGGHIAGDPHYYHSLALRKAAEMSSQGLTAFEFRPAGQGPAGIASLVYLLVRSPYGVVVVNAILHALSTVVIVSILRFWFSLRTSIVASIPLAISPYMMFWFSQLNKDSFSLAGALLFVYGLLRLTSRGRTLKNTGIDVLIVGIGVSLIGLMRPYMNQILMPITMLILLITVGFDLWKHPGSKEWARLIVSGALVLLCLALLSRGATSDVTLDGFDNFTAIPTNAPRHAIVESAFASIDQRNWRNAQFLPDYVNRKLRAVMGQRCLMFTLLETQDNPTTLYSIVDTDRLPSGSLEALAYFPRAALVGIFSPWPNRWFYVITHSPSVFYATVPIEAAVVYIGLAGLAIWFVIRKAWRILIPLGLSFTVMAVLAMANPSIGVLYRYRYPWWMILLCFGIAAWIALTEEWRRKRAEPPSRRESQLPGRVSL
jgi:hypothetical protein